MSDKVTRILMEISRLTLAERAELARRAFGDDSGGSAGVREPARPKPPAPREGRA